MENMICEAVQKKISSGELLSPEEKCHTDRCPDCGNFLAFCGKIRNLPPYDEREIPESAESIIRAEGFRNLIRRRRHSLIRRIGIPAAAAVFVCASLFFYGTKEPTPKIWENTTLQSTGTAWSTEYDEKLLAMTWEMDSVMTEMDESLKTVSI